MGHNTIDRHLCPKSNTGDHVADLADNVVGQQSTDIILQNSINNTINRHDNTQNNQDL